jgi:phosphatidylinositol alpha-1,6-mannosyltransferase
MNRYVVITPGISGADGIAALSRLVVRALAQPTSATVDVLSLLDSTPPDYESVDFLANTPPSTVLRTGFETPPGEGGSSGRTVGSSISKNITVRPEEAPSLRGRLEGLSRRVSALSYGDSAMRVRFFGAGGSKASLAAAALRAAMRVGPNTQAICLHLHLSPLALPLRWRGARLAIILCGIEAWKALSRPQAHAARRADVMMAISAHTARRFREANPAFDGSAVQICHPAIPADVRAADASTAPVTRYPTALIVGRMVAEERYKGHDLLLDLWPRVLTQVDEARLIVVGDGDDRARLEARAAEMKLREHVLFLGRVSDARLAQLYRECSFFVMPSRDEGFGLVFLEAMRAGKACIGGVGAAEEIIEDGVTGLVVDPQQPASVLGALLRLFGEVETRERMGRAGAERCAREFTEACFQRRFRSLLGLQSEDASW